MQKIARGKNTLSNFCNSPVGQTEPCCTCDSTRSFVLSKPSGLFAESPRGGFSELRSSLSLEQRSSGGIGLVDRSPDRLERSSSSHAETRPGDRDGCLDSGLGIILPELPNRRSVELSGTRDAYKLLGAVSSLPGCKSISEVKSKSSGSPEDGP